MLWLFTLFELQYLHNLQYNTNNNTKETTLTIQFQTVQSLDYLKCYTLLILYCSNYLHYLNYNICTTYSTIPTITQRKQHLQYNFKQYSLQTTSSTLLYLHYIALIIYTIWIPIYRYIYMTYSTPLTIAQ